MRIPRPIASSLCHALAAVLLFGAASLESSAAEQQRPLRLIAGFPPGAAIDIMARMLSDKLRDSLGRPVLVENKVGAGGIIGAETLKASPADGSVIMIAPIAVPVIYLHSYPSLRYNTFNDFEPIAHLANFAIALAVSTDTPAATLAEYVKVVQGNANFGNYGSASPGSIPHFFGLMLARHANVTLTHIPYKGTAPMLQALAAGEIKAGIGTLADIGSLARGGKAKLLAISSAQRSTHFPNVPTFKEAGFDIQGSGWYAVYAPAKTPRAEIDRLAKALIDAVKMPDITEKWANMGLEPTGLGPEDTARITKADYERWGPVIKASGFKPDQ